MESKGKNAPCTIIVKLQVFWRKPNKNDHACNLWWQCMQPTAVEATPHAWYRCGAVVQIQPTLNTPPPGPWSLDPIAQVLVCPEVEERSEPLLLRQLRKVGEGGVGS